MQALQLIFSTTMPSMMYLLHEVHRTALAGLCTQLRAEGEPRSWVGRLTLYAWAALSPGLCINQSQFRSKLGGAGEVQPGRWLPSLMNRPRLPLPAVHA